MSSNNPIPLQPFRIAFGDTSFSEIRRWPMTDRYISRMLDADISRILKQCKGWMFGYRDPFGQIAGFGTLEICSVYAEHTAKSPHLYIPLLAVNPSKLRLGHGTSIVQHLVAEAAIFRRILRAPICNVIFLDVYASNLGAIKIYEQCGFEHILSEPVFDAHENANYFVMAKSLPDPPPRPAIARLP